MQKHTYNRESLLDILRLVRPAGSDGEAVLLETLDAVPGMAIDRFGNRIIRIGKKGKRRSVTMFSCHTDTVAGRFPFCVNFSFEQDEWWKEPLLDVPEDREFRFIPEPEPEPTSQMVSITSDNIAFLEAPHCGDVLGADDGAGVYILLRMIEAKVPGLYVFHRSEEIGGLGSTWIAKHSRGLLAGIRRCIAFDRRGTADIVNRQMGVMCCSDTFVVALSDALGMGHGPATGTFTDSANYAHIISECTNVSIGYENEHSESETLDLDYVEALIEALTQVDFEALPTKRKAKARHRVQTHFKLL